MFSLLQMIPRGSSTCPRTVALVVAVLLLLLSALPVGAQQSIASRAIDGTPNFWKGDLGRVAPLVGEPGTRETDADFEASVTAFIHQFVAENLGASGTEELRITDVEKDALGNAHVRFEEFIGGLRVFGAALMVHSDALSGVVRVVNGDFASAAGVPDAAALDARRAMLMAMSELDGQDAHRIGGPRLGYVIAPSGEVFLTWRQLVEYEKDDFFHRDLLFADAQTGSLITRHPTIHPVKSWRTYNGRSLSSLPGTLDCTNDQSCSDQVIQDAHDNAGLVWDYYNAQFGRDSLNDNGFTLISTAHHRNNYNNAFWNGSQMAYGDGDGVLFSPLGSGFDVVAHELTHGVTSFESDLIYQNESGALNEALSDIFSAAAEAWRDGAITDDTWKLGEDIYTPATAGDALRYMDDPTDDGSSYDYWPERYTGSQDNGGVHWNSGIANLAFYLMVEGGTHPRGKTSVSVTGFGMDKAEQIFYRAQTTYLTASSNFAAARAATAQAAGDLYGAAEQQTVHDAWCAVGVPNCPTDPPDPPSGGELTKGVAKTGLSGSTSDTKFFFIDVPANAQDLVFTMSGGSGDADLYVRRGSEPTTTTYDCRPYNSGNSETCSFDDPSAARYHVMVRAYRTYSGVSLVADYETVTDPPDPPASSELENGVPRSDLDGDRLSQQFFTIEVPTNARDLAVQLSGGSGDADLYLRRGSKPTTSSYDCRPYKIGNNELCEVADPQAGTWHVMLRGYSSFSNTTLVATWEDGGDPPAGCDPQVGSVSDLSDFTGGQKVYTFEVDDCAELLEVTISGGSGDADLYVRFGSPPTTSNYQCRPYKSGNNESCEFDDPQAGTWYLMVRAYRTYSGVDLEAKYE